MRFLIENEITKRKIRKDFGIIPRWVRRANQLVALRNITWVLSRFKSTAWSQTEKRLSQCIDQSVHFITAHTSRSLTHTHTHTQNTSSSTHKLSRCFFAQTTIAGIHVGLSEEEKNRTNKLISVYLIWKRAQAFRTTPSWTPRVLDETQWNCLISPKRKQEPRKPKRKREIQCEIVYSCRNQLNNAAAAAAIAAVGHKLFTNKKQNKQKSQEEPKTQPKERSSLVYRRITGAYR